jgi:hypothetical protein
LNRFVPLALVMFIAACPHKRGSIVGPDTPVTPGGAPELHISEGNATPVPGNPELRRHDYTQTTLPKGLAVFHGVLVWADVAGAIWTMPADGSRPAKQLSDQHKEGFAFHPFVSGDRVFAKTKRDLLAIAVPDGPVTHLGVTGLADLPEEATANAEAVFCTVYQHDDVLRIPASGGAAKHLADVQRGVLAVHGDTLYVASYTTGQLIAVPIAGGPPRVIVKDLAHPTALAADDHAVYVYTETDQTAKRIDLATQKITVLGDHLVNSDELVLAGDALYTVSWPNRLVKLPIVAGGAAVAIADDLDMPRSVVVDDHYVYVTSSTPLRVVKVPR